MELSIAIVNWNTRDMLKECLDKLFTSLESIQPMLDFEVIVVDNGSTDNSLSMLSNCYPSINVIANGQNMGFARANNQAIRASKGRYVLLLNSDAFISDDSLQKMVALLDKYPEIAIAGARLIYPDGRPQVSHGPLPSLFREILSLAGLDKLFNARSESVKGNAGYIRTGTVEGACLMARRSVLDQIGLMDESFFFFSEEVDLCFRAHEAGWIVAYVPETRVVHVRGGSTGVVPSRVLLLYKGKLQYFEKHYGMQYRHKLYMAIVMAIRIKVILYSCLRLLSFGRLKKDALWMQVADGINALQDTSKCK